MINWIFRAIYAAQWPCVCDATACNLCTAEINCIRQKNCYCLLWYYEINIRLVTFKVFWEKQMVHDGSLVEWMLCCRWGARSAGFRMLKRAEEKKRKRRTGYQTYWYDLNLGVGMSVIQEFFKKMASYFMHFHCCRMNIPRFLSKVSHCALAPLIYTRLEHYLMHPRVGVVVSTPCWAISPLS